MIGEDAELDMLNAYEEEDEARARMMADKYGIEFDPAPAQYRHPFLNGDSMDHHH